MAACILKALKWLILALWWLTGRVFFIAVILFICYFFSQTPSLKRDWNIDQAILPEISFSGTIVNVKNVRNFEYRSTNDYTPGYYDASYDMNTLESVWYIIEPFSENDGPAHTMLSFGFGSGKYVVVSAEIRKEKGESFKILPALTNQFELTYVIADERDAIKLRSNYRKDDVFLYPVRTTPDKMRALFISAMKRADKLTREPEFYHLIWNTCTTNILHHVNALREEKIPFSQKVFLPSHSDEIAIEADLIDTNLSPQKAREYYRINDLALQFANDPLFSERIRKERK